MFLIYLVKDMYSAVFNRYLMKYYQFFIGTAPFGPVITARPPLADVHSICSSGRHTLERASLLGLGHEKSAPHSYIVHNTLALRTARSFYTRNILNQTFYLIVHFAVIARCFITLCRLFLFRILMQLQSSNANTNIF